MKKSYIALSLLALMFAWLLVAYSARAPQVCSNYADCTHSLEQAAAANDIFLLRLVLALPPGSYDIDADKGSILGAAVGHENEDMVDLVLRAQADPGIAEQMPLKLALQLGNQPIVKMLLDAGAARYVADEMDGYAPPAIVAFTKAYVPDARYYGVYGLPIHGGGGK